MAYNLGSHPHGCVSWNPFPWLLPPKHYVTPSRVCELKSSSESICTCLMYVTPSRVCELKSLVSSLGGDTASHPHGCVCWNLSLFFSFIKCISHTLTGVWVEINCIVIIGLCLMSHPHGCVSWNLLIRITVNWVKSSHPHGCVSWNPGNIITVRKLVGHTLTGVWVEMTLSERFGKLGLVTPSRVCELKFSHYINYTIMGVTPSRVCELKFLSTIRAFGIALSHPHGCVSWNCYQGK